MQSDSGSDSSEEDNVVLKRARLEQERVLKLAKSSKKPKKKEFPAKGKSKGKSKSKKSFPKNGKKRSNDNSDDSGSSSDSDPDPMDDIDMEALVAEAMVSTPCTQDRV
jgi:hypothetical protein